MSLWIKAFTITTVVVLVYSTNIVYNIDRDEYRPAPEYMEEITPAMPITRPQVSKEELLEDLDEEGRWFKPFFFEVMSFRGIQRNRAGYWVAIFADGNNRLVRLAEGQKYEGVKVHEVTSNTCLVRYGSFEKFFEL